MLRLGRCEFWRHITISGPVPVPPGGTSVLALIVAVGALAATGPSAATAGPEHRSIRMRGGAVSIPPATGPAARAVRTARASGRFLLAVDAPLTRAQVQSLAAAGIRVGDYLPDSAYIVSLRGVAPGVLRSLPYVRGLARFDPAWKRAPELGTRPFNTDERRKLAAANKLRVIAWSFHDSDAAVFRAGIATLGTVTTETSSAGGHHRVVMEIDRARLHDLAANAEVQFIDEAPEFQTRNDRSAWVSQSNVTLEVPLWDYGLHGEGHVGGLIDQMVRESHCMFDDAVAPGPTHRKLVAFYGSTINSSHGTHVCGTFVGDSGPTGGNVCYNGVAFAAKATYRLLNQIYVSITLYNAFVTAHNDGARIHSNSYGASTTAYDTTCVDIDQFSRDYEDDLVLFAVANGNLANMLPVQNPENAKNVLAVAAAQAPPNQHQHQSGLAGPTADGRRKPEVYTVGNNVLSAWVNSACDVNTSSGTSMATPAVAGHGMLIRQYFLEGFYPDGAANPGNAFVPSGALIKAVLVNSAVDMAGISGYPSNREGWGRILLENSLYFAGDNRRLWLRDRRNAGGFTPAAPADSFAILNRNTDEPLQVTLVFTDVPGAVSSLMPVVNNLDLQVTSPTGTVYRGNVFDTLAGVSQTGGSFDALNNVEQVRVLSPAAGVWTVQVSPTTIAGPVGDPRQGYALVVTGNIAGESPVILIEPVDPPPTQLIAGQPETLIVRVQGGTESLVGGSPTLHYRVTPPGGSYSTSALTPLGANLYQAVIPAAPCGSIVEYYFSAVGSGATTVHEPAGGAATPFVAASDNRNIVLDDAFETDQGWTVTAGATSGNFARGVPQQTTQCTRVAQSGSDHTPGGCSSAYATGLTAGGDANALDLDGGPTRLTSPLLDLSAFTSVNVSAWIWFYDGYLIDDDVTVDVSTNGGATWTTAVTLGNGRSSWQYVSFNIEDFGALTAQVQIRVSAADGGLNSTAEVLVDDVRVVGYGCAALPDCLVGDMDDDGDVDGPDIQPFLDVVFSSCPPAYSVQQRCAADINGDDSPDASDIPGFVTCLLSAGGCP